MNYFSARWYDPVLGRWHAPDPLEQFHSPYLAMCNDPANFVDPDDRAGIPWLQDFVNSDVVSFASGVAAVLYFATPGGSAVSAASSLGGTIKNIVSGALQIGSTLSSVQSIAQIEQFTTTDLTKLYAQMSISLELTSHFSGN
jgi:hypothetical protein